MTTRWPTSIVVLAHFDWDSHFMQFHKELLSEVARLGPDVLWVEGEPTPRTSPATWLRTMPAGRLTRSEPLWRLRPWTLPRSPTRPTRRVGDAMLAAEVRWAMKRLGLSHPAYLLYAPSELPVVRRLPGGPTVYWTGDEVTMAGNDDLLAYAELILAISPRTHQEIHRRHLGKVQPFSTGVAFDRYDAASRRAMPPRDLGRLPRPIVGYAGIVADTRIDAELVRGLAGSNPDVSFAFVGPVQGDLAKRLTESGAGNVHLLGRRPHETIPDYVAAFDVGIVPYALNPFNLGANPLKIYEYLAAGVPTVATDLPVLAALGDVVCVARSYDEFYAAVRAQLEAPPNPALVARRKEVALETSIPRLAARLVESVAALGASVERAS